MPSKHDLHFGKALKRVTGVLRGITCIPHTLYIYQCTYNLIYSEPKYTVGQRLTYVALCIYIFLIQFLRKLMQKGAAESHAKRR